jgi:environmental stress-induced protein Ves
MASPAFTPLDPATYRRTPWKNGGGVTIDIAGAHRPGADPAGWDGMIWRFGRTRIERPGPFSDLSGYDRILAVVEGRGLFLHSEGRAPLDVREPFAPVRFPGEWKIASELAEGPVGVVNLIAARASCAIDLRFLADRGVASVSGAPCIVLALADAVLDIGAQAVRLKREHAVRFDAPDPREIGVLEGRIAVASVRAREPAPLVRPSAE